MDKRQRMIKGIRRFLGVLLIAAGLSTTWAWGEVARPAEPEPGLQLPPVTALYAAWQQDGGTHPALFRSIDEGATWLPMALPGNLVPRVWADNGGRQVAVVTEEGSLLLSKDQGENWVVVDTGLEILSLAWGGEGNSLYAGTSGQGVYRLTTDGVLTASRMMPGNVAFDRIVSLSLSEGRLFAAMPDAVLYTDDMARSAGSVEWTRGVPPPDLITVIAAAGRQTLYAGTTTTGVFKSVDAGQTWEPARNGQGLAAGQMVRIAALKADPLERGLLYAAVDYLVGSTHIHSSAAGIFATADGGTSWQPLAGPSFPEARHALSLVLIPGQPLHVEAVTEGGLQGYAPDVMRILAALESDDPKVRASAARQLGLARPQGVWKELLASMDDPDPAVGLAAANALGRINDPAAVPGLLLALEHPSEPVRLGAARAVGMMEVEAAVEPLRAMLLRGEGSEVSVAGEALGRIGGPAATDALLTALADLQPTARWHVAMAALERMGEPAVAPLLTMLDSQDAHARRNAAQALGWMGSASATEALVDAIKKDGDASVRAEAAWALGEIGDPAARRALGQAQLRDPSIEVQTAAGRALSRVPTQLEAATGWGSHWAPVLSRLYMMRWLVLVLSLIGAAWLMMGSESLAAAPLRALLRRR